jgi:hypothetical protein
MTLELADFTVIDKIARDLWCGREFGRAAAFIGAGFSLNAVPAGSNGQRFPTWCDISTRLVDALYPPLDSVTRGRQNALYQAKSISGSLRLAQEFEAAFCRSDLDALLLDAIPDEAFSPSHLHRLLLSLNWADVLTTNYDTLLERAATKTIERRYNIVRVQSEISRAMKPRIVKLHGCFPSTTPFIITEEDFRTYPRVFAPFVNMAQQIMMENTIVLLGFSGDDPNFLFWSGWVRDNLGAGAPNIYLCGILDLTAARRRMLETRRVIPLDLAPLFPANKWPDPVERHAAATEWFLLALEGLRPPDVLDWPHFSKWPATPPTRDLPDRPVGTISKMTAAEQPYPNLNANPQ